MNESPKKATWLRILRQRRSAIPLGVIASFLLISLFAEILANDRPIVMRYENHWLFPVFKIYPGATFGSSSPVEPSYKELLQGASHSKNAWALWPIVRWAPNETNHRVSHYPSPPSAQNLLGTDDRGRDILTRLIYGFRVSFAFGFINMLLAGVLATLIGGVQGYFGGKLDLFGQRVVEIWSSLPYLYVLILIVNIFEPGLAVLILTSALFVWIRLSYYMRAVFLKSRKEDYVVAARALGANSTRILWKHILPNCLTPLITFSPFIMALAITNLAVLDYLGLGVPPPTASLGELLRQGRMHFMTSWWLALFPFAVLVTLTACLCFFGEGVRESLDPRRRTY